MRQKRELSERIQKSENWLKTLRLTKELEAKEALLTENYKKRKIRSRSKKTSKHVRNSNSTVFR